MPSFGRNPRGSPNFLAYPVPKACMHVLGTRVPRRLGVARSTSSPKAAQALGCRLTSGLRISFGWVTCMARAASVPGLWALGFLLLCGVCVWVWLAVGCGYCQPRQSGLESWVGVFGHRLWCCPSSVGCLWCSWLGFGSGLLLGRVRLRGRPACPPPFPVLACGVGVCAGPFLPGLSGCVFCTFVFISFLGVPVPGLVVPVPPSPFFRAGLLALSLFFPACFSVPFPGGLLFLAWCCRFWVGGPPVFLWGSCLRCLLGGGLAASGGVGGRFGGCGLFSRLFPLPPPFFFSGGGLPVPPSAVPGLVHALACIQCCLPGSCFQLRSVWPRPGPMGRVGYVHGGLGAPSCRVRSWLCRLGGCARRLLVVLG